jgi:hypothetical protein
MMTAETSAGPAAIDGLLALCTGAASLTGVTIYDGSPVARSSDELFLEIAVPSADGLPAVEGTQEFVTMPGRERDESFTILCGAYSRSGDTDIKAERDRAYGILAAVERLIRPRESGSDITLGGAVLWSSVTGRITYTPLQTTDGAGVRVMFQIACRARLSGS